MVVYLNMEELINRLSDSIAISREMREDPDNHSWHDQEGVVLSQNEAKEILKYLKEYQSTKEALKL
jgi:hypothetical protein